MIDKTSVLVISSLFPDSSRPIYGIFVKNQVYYQRLLCNQIVVVPVRIFPPAEIWKKIIHPSQFFREIKRWYLQMKAIPFQENLGDIPVHYPRYSSVPRPLIGIWGLFAYLFLGRLLLALHQKHHFDIIHAHYALPEGMIALLLQKRVKIPFVISIHGGDLTYAAKQNALNRLILRKVLSHADAISANSAKTAQEIANYCDSKEKIFVVRLGANPPEFVDTVDRKKQDALWLLSVGYLLNRKGHRYVLEAIQILLREGYNISYMIVGDGPEKQNLYSLSLELGIQDHVVFEGHKSQDEVWPYYASNCDIFVLPSWDEAFGLVYIEALSMGKPVIGCEGEGGPEDLKKLGDCIELVKPKDITTLVNALKGLIDNPERRQLMAKTGREVVQKYYSWEHTALNTLAIYQQVIQNYKGKKSL